MALSKELGTWGFPCLVVGALVASLGLAGCENSSDSEPDIVPESQLEFVPRSDSAPALETTDTSFFAVKGEDRRLEIRYVGVGGDDSGERFLRLDIEEETLLRRPDGTLFAAGDSVEIRVVVDPVLFLANFEPAGLQFNPNEPAELEYRYDQADDDFLVRESEFDLWRQERPGDPWERLGSLQVEELDEIEVELLGFTRYALAVGR